MPQPNNNREFWNNKFHNEVERDKWKESELFQIVWKVLVVLECKMKPELEKSVDKVSKELDARS